MRALSTFLILALATVTCVTLYAQQKVSDDVIHDEVLKKLAHDSTAKGGGFGVEVKDGVVTLTGKVRSEKQKDRAESLTKKVRGVTKVINKLVLEK